MINELIRKMRRASGFSQKQLANKIGMAFSSISGYELGTNEPSFNTVAKIAKVCDFEILMVDKNSGETIKVKNKKAS